jgi:CheY-like chemotaxis protein
MTASARSIQGRRVLLVEDEYLIAEDLRRSFRDAGAMILGPVPTTHDAIAILDRGEPVDAAVLDVNLRGEAVYPLVDRLQADRVPMVFVTGYDATEIPSRYRHIPLCEKPATMSRMIAALTR